MGACLQPSRFSTAERLLIHTRIHLDEGRGALLILCLPEVPGPKDACLHYLATGGVDSRPGTNVREQL